MNVLGPMDGDGDGQAKNIDFDRLKMRWQYNLQVKCFEAKKRALEKQAQHRDQQLQHGGEPGQHYDYYQGQNQGMM